MDFDLDFGLNAPFVEELYQRYLDNPAGVDEGWRRYFGGQGAGAKNGSNGNGHAANGGATNGAAQAFEALQQHDRAIPLASLPSTATPRSAPADRLAAKLRQEGVAELINAYRLRGHLFADIDPLGLLPKPPDELSLEHFGLSERDLDRSYATGDLVGPPMLTLREIVALLRRTYCRTIGVEYMHGEEPAVRRWLQERMESSQNQLQLTPAERLRILARLTDAEALETFLHKKYIGAKRFSLEGGESLIPLLDWTLDEAGLRGVEEAVIGMAHRGRLNILVNIVQMSLGELFTRFEDKDAREYLGRGDVKYHLGYSAERALPNGKSMHLSLAFNPSHLEWVNPVVEGRVRAKQDRDGRDPDGRKVLPILIHGDAAFVGQGLVAETLNLAGLEGYRTGGTIHVVINNQVGFTTDPQDGRSTPYCTDIARVLRAPVFHVNGEDPEAVAWVIRLAVEYRQTFGRDVLIDMYCYRKYGHNEADEPAFTQPKMYAVIRGKPSVRQIYADRLREDEVIDDAGAAALLEKSNARLEEALEATRRGDTHAAQSAMADKWKNYKGGLDAQVPEAATAVPLAHLQELSALVCKLPAGFSPHEKIAGKRGVFEGRLAAAHAPTEPLVDWGIAEHLAFASLLWDGTPIRFSGQDARRGTFSHRHATLADVKTGARYTPLAHLKAGQGRFDIFDSPLSEAGVLGFDYGYSLDMPDALVIWEAQFGDFVNGAQVVIDQFLSSSEDKWNRLSGLVMLLPHGFEGQGPEHSSARLERFLSLCAEDNLQVCNLTTPAQYFHVLRRQIVRPYRKPLVIMTPKSLLRHKVSTLAELAEGGFQRIVPDALPKKQVRRVLLCTGKVYYDLAAARDARKAKDVAIVRLEQLYPLSDEQLVSALKGYGDGTDVFWVQEEPFNMGGWYFIRARWPKALGERLPLHCVSRPESASPATGSAASHKLEQQLLVDQAFAPRS